jgi:hypothetical protein
VNRVGNAQRQSYFKARRQLCSDHSGGLRPSIVGVARPDLPTTLQRLY